MNEQFIKLLKEQLQATIDLKDSLNRYADLLESLSKPESYEEMIENEINEELLDNSK